MEETDAIAIPGFGVAGDSPPIGGGLTLQADDGTAAVSIRRNEQGREEVVVKGPLVADALTLRNANAPGGGLTHYVDNDGVAQTRQPTP